MNGLTVTYQAVMHAAIAGFFTTNLCLKYSAIWSCQNAVKTMPPESLRAASCINYRAVLTQASAAMPALAICASSDDLTPDTPTAPTTWPSTMIGTPPSSMPSIKGALRNDMRPPLIMSS